MKKLIQIGRWFFVTGMIGFCFHQMMYADLKPVFLASWPNGFPLQQQISVVVCLLLIVEFVSIGFGKNAKTLAFVTATLFLIFFLGNHLPYQLKTNPAFLGGWTDALKLVILSGGTYIISDSFERKDKELPPKFFTLNILGKYLVGIPIIIFGIEHFVYIEFVATLVPGWIPGHIFWTYLAGIGLILAGISIVINIETKLACLLLGSTIFIWFIVLHIPRAIADPVSGNGNEVRSVFQSLAFSGIAFVLAGMAADRRTKSV